MLKRHLVAVVVFALLSLLAACGQTGDSTDGAERTPFGVVVQGDDGNLVSLDGYRDGYRSGAAETVRLAVHNNTGQAWHGGWCLQLLEPVPSAVVHPLADDGFDLETGSGFEQDVTVDIPADLPSGTYGLALVSHAPTGPFVSVTPVGLGEEAQGPFQGEWPTQAALDACPAP